MRITSVILGQLGFQLRAWTRGDPLKQETSSGDRYADLPAVGAAVATNEKADGRRRLP